MEFPAPVLVLGGPIRWNRRLHSRLEHARPLFAADGGANSIVNCGLKPDLVIGDLDSIRPDVLEALEAGKILQRTDQTRTDFEKALEYLFVEKGLNGLTVLGALGGRPDHSAGNLGVLARECRGEGLVFLGEETVMLAASGRLVLDSVPGETWSFWSFDPELRLSLEGVRWPLDQARVHLAGSPSISNEATGRQVRILAEEGSVLVCRNFLGEEEPVPI